MGQAQLGEDSTNAWFTQVFLKYLEVGAIAEIHKGSSHNISRAFLIPKDLERTQWRLIVDLRSLNAYLYPLAMKIETLLSLSFSVCAPSWIVTFDIVDALFLIPLHP